MNSKKKVLSVFNGSFFRNLVRKGHSFFNFSKGSLFKISLGNSVLEGQLSSAKTQLAAGKNYRKLQ